MSAFALTGQQAPSRIWLLWPIAVYGLAAVALAPVAAVQGPELPAIVPIILAGIMTIELATGFLLFARFAEVRSWSMLLLACGYLYSGSMAVAQLLTFPGAVLPGRPVLGGEHASGWLFLLWMNGYAALMLAATCLEAFSGGLCVRRKHVGASIAAGCLASLAAAGCQLAAYAGTGLPALLRGGTFIPFGKAINDFGLLLMAAAILVVVRAIRGRNVVFQWLAVALGVLIASNALALAGGGRFTVGWYMGRLAWLVWAAVLFIFFMWRFVARQRSLSRTHALLERRVEERTAALADSLRQRDVLLREVYHRVKNNLQIVDSLLAMESRRLPDPIARDVLGELRNRVQALGLVHQQLMSSNNLETFSIAPFLRQLCSNIALSHGAAAGGIVIVADVESVRVGLDFAIPVGLLTTELLSSAIRRARATRVQVAFARLPEGRALLAVCDDGRDASAMESRPAPAGDVGSRIIAGLTRQIEGEMAIVQRDGIRVEIRMPLPEAP